MEKSNLNLISSLTSLIIGSGFMIYGIFKDSVPFTIAGATLYISGSMKDCSTYLEGCYREQQLRNQQDNLRNKPSKLEKI